MIPKIKTERFADRVRAILMTGGITLVILFLLWSIYALLRRGQNLVDKAVLSPAPSAAPDEPFRTGLEDTVVIPAAESDADKDGLSDALEAIYKTDPRLSDTDGDGYLDGQEVANGYDPTIPSPNDAVRKIAAASPGPGATPLESPAPPTFTQQYVNQTSTTVTPQTLKAGDPTLRSFVATASARGVLPTIADSAVRISDEPGRDAIVRYLDAVSIPQNPLLTAVDASDISSAFTSITTEKNAAPLDSVLKKLDRNAAALADVSVPREALALHKQYLGASLALRESAQLLRNYRADYIGALVGSSRLETLRGTFREIEKGIQALEKKYNIT